MGEGGKGGGVTSKAREEDQEDDVFTQRHTNVGQ